MDFSVKAGSLFVKNGSVQEVATIEEDPKTKKKIVVFRPKFGRASQTMTCRIPLENLDKIEARHLKPKSTWQKIFKEVGELIKIDLAPTPATVKEFQHNPRKLLSMWMSTQKLREESDKPLTYTQKQLLGKIKRILSEEVALVFGLDLEQAEQKLHNAYQTVAG